MPQLSLSLTHSFSNTPSNLILEELQYNANEFSIKLEIQIEQLIEEQKSIFETITFRLEIPQLGKNSDGS